MNSDLIAEAITDAYGERCPDFEPTCFGCKAWMQYDALRAERDRLREAASEGLDILTNLYESIAKHGNYSAESTMDFIDQAGACLREALAEEAGQ
jgi:hypothetical protein